MYHKLGEIPHKRHTIFKKNDGTLYHEELLGKEGFSSDSSLAYHLHAPTQVKKIGKSKNIEPVAAVEHNIQSRRVKCEKVNTKQSFFKSKISLFFNSDLTIGIANCNNDLEDIFYKNASSDELLFIHYGKGVLKTYLGDLKFQPGDYLIIPKGIIYQIEFETKENRVLYIESHSNIKFPKRYLSSKGQFLEHSPFCERDIRLPENLKVHDEQGDFTILINKHYTLHEVVYKNHPFDIVGWDGYYYPYAFSIHDFEPITGRIHQPPPVHQTFEGRNFVVCSFCPRLYDYHPHAIPAPYNHSNIDSDELLYYVEGDFMSRANIKVGDITIHPAGIPHGPHPGTVEKSIGKKRTEELAVMVDPFRPLKITQAVLDMEDPDYYKSWLTK